MAVSQSDFSQPDKVQSIWSKHVEEFNAAPSLSMLLKKTLAKHVFTFFNLFKIRFKTGLKVFIVSMQKSLFWLRSDLEEARSVHTEFQNRASGSSSEIPDVAMPGSGH